MAKIKVKSKNTLYNLADLFKNFSDSTRLKILYTLIEKERTVNEISLSIEMNQSAVSHQLRILKDSKLIKSRKDGKNVYYSLNDYHVHDILKDGIEHVEEEN